MNPILFFFLLISYAIHVYSGVIIAYVLLSLFTFYGQAHPSVHRLHELLARCAEPLLAPIRQMLTPITSRIGLDFSPMVALFFLQFIATLLPLPR